MAKVISILTIGNDTASVAALLKSPFPLVADIGDTARR